MRQFAGLIQSAGLFISLSLFFLSCADRAQRVVDEAIETHGGRAFHNFTLEFDFRNRHYSASRNGGMYIYTREFTDSTGQFRDVLNNDGFVRHRNGSAIEIPEERAQAYTRSVNSVIYFALLPFGLNDEAVNKEWLGEAQVMNEPYQMVRVTFDAEGGGEDHQDVFLYWFHSQRKTMDFFAYSYTTDGGGVRFRQAINSRHVGPLLLQDYINFKPADETIAVDSMMPLFLAGRLQKLSVIALENPSVETPGR